MVTSPSASIEIGYTSLSGEHVHAVGRISKFGRISFCGHKLFGTRIMWENEFLGHELACAHCARKVRKEQNGV